MTRSRTSAKAATWCEIEYVTDMSALHNSNHRGHWSVGSKKRAAMRRDFGNLALAKRLEVGVMEPPVSVRVTFDFPDKRRRDLDNFEIKGLIDGIVDGGLLPDDDARNIVSVTRAAGGSSVPKGCVRLMVTLRHEGSFGVENHG